MECLSDWGPMMSFGVSEVEKLGFLRGNCDFLQCLGEPLKYFLVILWINNIGVSRRKFLYTVFYGLNDFY
jgi:hypothetical protein